MQGLSERHSRRVGGAGGPSTGSAHPSHGRCHHCDQWLHQGRRGACEQEVVVGVPPALPLPIHREADPTSQPGGWKEGAHRLLGAPVLVFRLGARQCGPHGRAGVS